MKANIKKVKNRLRRKSRVSVRKIATKLDISRFSDRRILKNGIGLRPYTKIMELSLSDDQKIMRKKICKLGSNKFSKRGHNENPLFR